MMNLFSGSQKHEDFKTAMKCYCNKKKKIVHSEKILTYRTEQVYFVHLIMDDRGNYEYWRHESQDKSVQKLFLLKNNSETE